MRIKNFSLTIPQGSESDSGHVVMAHGATYTIDLANYTDRRADAEVFVDGKSVGTFRLNVYGSVRLERPDNDNGCFTFYRAGSSEAQQADVGSVEKVDRGLVQVIFRPEIELQPAVPKVHPISASQRRRIDAQSPSDLKGAVGERRGAGGSSAGGQHCNSSHKSCSQMSFGPEVEQKTSGGIALNFCSDTPGVEVSSRAFEAGMTGLSGHSKQAFFNVSPLTYDPSLEVTLSLRLVAASNEPRPLKPKCSGNPVPVAVG